MVVDRGEAIRALFDLLARRPQAEPWVALIAGKGHEINGYLGSYTFTTTFADMVDLAEGPGSEAQLYHMIGLRVS